LARNARRRECLEAICGAEGLFMRKLAILLGPAAICIAFWRFLLAPFFLSERPRGATGLLLAAGLFTIAIAAIVRR
jgi:hypothetical protein